MTELGPTEAFLAALEQFYADQESQSLFPGVELSLRHNYDEFVALMEVDSVTAATFWAGQRCSCYRFAQTGK